MLCHIFYFSFSVLPRNITMNKGNKPTFRPKKRNSGNKKPQGIVKLIAKMSIESANKVEDFESLNLPKTFESGDQILDIVISKAEALDDNMKNQICDLTETNMKDLYENSSWGWSSCVKNKELLHKEAYHIVAKTSAGELCGFSHFRFVIEADQPVLYCYELQVDSKIQRKGLGKFLMECLCTIAKAYDMVKIMLTVFKKNDAACNFYIKKMGYRIDRISPTLCGDLSCFYDILSKKVVKEQKNKDDEKE